MLKEVITKLRDTFLMYKEVSTFRYQDKLLNNAQGNYKPFQVYLDTTSHHRLNITTNIFIAEFEIYILAIPEDNNILDIQDTAYDIACNVMAKIDNESLPYLSVYDYSILTVDHMTDDDSAGVKLSLQLQIPSPVDLCTYEDDFEPYIPEPDDNPITVPDNTIGNITLKPTKLPKDASRCY